MAASGSHQEVLERIKKINGAVDKFELTIAKIQKKQRKILQSALAKVEQEAIQNIKKTINKS